MKFKEILAISGQSGLYRYVARSTHGIIVESLSDNRRFNATGSARISALSEISVFTEGEDLPLWKVFDKMSAFTQGKKGPDHKEDQRVIRQFISDVLPDYDRERVHFSDMKKMVCWFNVLIDAGMTDFSVEDPQEEAKAEPESEEKSAQEA